VHWYLERDFTVLEAADEFVWFFFLFFLKISGVIMKDYYFSLLKVKFLENTQVI